MLGRAGGKLFFAFAPVFAFGLGLVVKSSNGNDKHYAILYPIATPGLFTPSPYLPYFTLPTPPGSIAITILARSPYRPLPRAERAVAATVVGDGEEHLTLLACPIIGGHLARATLNA